MSEFELKAKFLEAQRDFNRLNADRSEDTIMRAPSDSFIKELTRHRINRTQLDRARDDYVFAAQLTQIEVNTLYGRGFKKVDEGSFDQQTLEDMVNKHREIFNTSRPDKRCKEHITIVTETYDQPPLYAQTSTVARAKRALPKEDWSWDSSYQTKKRTPTTLPLCPTF